MSNNLPGIKDKRKYLKHSFKINSLDYSMAFVSHTNRHIFAGLSLERAFMHWGLRSITLAQPVIDYGSGSNKPDYYQYFSKQVVDLTLTDFYIEGEGIEKLDLEKAFTLKKKYSSFVCLNVFEHIYNKNILMKSIADHLSEDGHGIISTPYLYQYHPSPHDFWRYSPEAFERIAAQAGLQLTEVVYLGKGPFVASVAMIWNVLPRLLRLVTFWLAWSLDSILLRFSSMFSHNYALGYIFLVKKSKKRPVNS